MRRDSRLLVAVLFCGSLAACTAGTIGGPSGHDVASDNVANDGNGDGQGSSDASPAFGTPGGSGHAPSRTDAGPSHDPDDHGGGAGGNPGGGGQGGSAGGNPGGGNPGGGNPGGGEPGSGGAGGGGDPGGMGGNPGGGDPYAGCVGWHPVPDGWQGTIKDICGACEVAHGKRCAYVGGSEIYLHCTVDNTVVIPPENKYENFKVGNCNTAPSYDHVIWDSIECVAPDGAPYNPCVY